MTPAGGAGRIAALAFLLLRPDGRARAQDSTRITQQFQRELDRLQREEGFPGGTAAFVLPDGWVSGVASGFADRERRVRMTPETRMLAASIGKMFVAATTVALAHEGKLDLDGSIERWLGGEPWFPRLARGPDITLRMLLSHSAGVGNHYRDPAFIADWATGRQADPEYAPPARTLIQYILDQPPLFPLGKGFSYTDTGYLLVGLIIERATGSTYYAEVNRRFLVPLGLKSTSPSDRRQLPGLAPGYSEPDNRFHMPVKGATGGVLSWNPAIEWTGGGLVSTSKDLVRWAKALFEEKAMPAPYLAEMLAGVPGNPAREPEGSRYGLGVRIAETPIGTYYGHGGSIPGYRSGLAYFPAKRVAVAIQINTDAEPFHDRVPTVYLKSLAKVVLDAVP